LASGNGVCEGVEVGVTSGVGVNVGVGLGIGVGVGVGRGISSTQPANIVTATIATTTNPSFLFMFQLLLCIFLFSINKGFGSTGFAPKFSFAPKIERLHLYSSKIRRMSLNKQSFKVLFIYTHCCYYEVENVKWIVTLLVGAAAGIVLMLALSSAQPNPGVLAPEPATDEEVAWIKSEIEKWREDPEMQIAATAIHRAEKTVVLWVYERTPENQQLHHKRINGWEIIVAESPKPSVIETLTHPPCVWILAGCLIVILATILVKYRRRRRDRSATS
jgi:hypothetical protein